MCIDVYGDSKMLWNFAAKHCDNTVFVKLSF